MLRALLVAHAARALAPCALACALAALTTHAPARAAGSGASVVTVAIPADGQSAGSAVRVARLADEVWARDADVVLLDLERVLEGGDPAWVDKLEEAKQSAQKGKQAMDALELNVAAESFADAIVKYEQGVAGMKDLTPLVDALVQQGAVYTLLGDSRAAKASFARALALDPAYRLGKDAAPARVIAAFETAMKEARGAGQGTLTVYATTGAAEVWVDGVFRGIAPFTVDINAGRHYVRVLRDGYLTFSTGVDVKRGSEASVQASLRPAARLAKLEELSVRIPRNKENVRAVADLAAALQVDQLLAVVVEDENGSALLTATLVDGVSGKQLARASRAFAPDDAFFDRDVRAFLDERIKRAQSRASEAGPTGPDPDRDPNVVVDGPSLLPGAAEPIEAPPSVTGGWVLVGLGGALVATAATTGIISFQLFDTYRNKVPSQLEPKLEEIRSTWLTLSIITDAAWLAAIGAGAGGAALLVSGYGEMAAQEEVVAP